MDQKVDPFTVSSNYDAERALDEREGQFSFSEQSVRLGFVRKVFAITTIQLLVTICFIALFFFTPSIAYFSQNSVPMLACSVVLTFALSIVFSCCENVRRTTPWNYVLLIIFTLAMSWMVGVITSYYTAESVLWAAGITAIITLALVGFALQTKIDFTYLSGILFVVLLSLIGFGIFASIFRSRILEAMYAGLGALVFGIYIVVDVQLMLGGHRSYALSPEEYIFAALNLYLDIINLFTRLLALFGKKR